MSVINQMLRDLDARDTGRGVAPAAPVRVAVLSEQPRRRWALPLLLAAGGAAGFAGWWNVRATLPPQAVRQPPAAQGELLAGVRETAPLTRAGRVPPRPDAVPMPARPGRTETSPALASAPQPVRPPIRLPVGVSALLPAVPASAAPAQALPAHTEPAIVKKMSETSPEFDAQRAYDDAQALRRAGKNDAAIASYRQALEHNPGLTQARIQLAGLLRENGQDEDALELLKAGYAQQPGDALAIAAGRMLADQGRRDEALEWLVRGQTGLRAADHALMGALWSQAQRHEDAVRAYQRAIDADPRQGGWLLGLGLSLESLGRMEESRVVYRRALNIGSFKPEVVRFLQQKIGGIGS